jgi:hypothetical protein
MPGFRKKPLLSDRPTNSPPPAPAPQIVEDTNQGSTTIHPLVEAPIASTSNIPVSHASTSCEPADTALDELGSSKESPWEVAYGAAKIAIEIANASSDMFCPLKAVAGALYILIKNYDVRLSPASLPIER